MATKISKKKRLIYLLIKNDLINYKLISGLNSMGLKADDYSLNLSDIIFGLMFPEDKSENDEIFESYIKRIKEVRNINISENHTSLDILTESIYKELIMLNK